MTDTADSLKHGEVELTAKYRLEERRGTGESARQGDTRRPYDRDYSRILHSSSFRRLQAKTQVLSLGHSDFYRTRLTHSLEAAQIGRGISHHLRHNRPECAYLLPPRSLVEASALAHDLGHPPFGHYGERQLNLLMREHGGFEGNGQTLRMLTELETGALSNGLNLSRRTLLAVLKYPVAYSDSIKARGYPKDAPTDALHERKGLTPPKCYFDSERPVVDWLLSPFTDDERRWLCELDVPTDPKKLAKTKHKTLDATIMELADDIAYGVHDLEDALRMERIGRDELAGGKYGIEAKMEAAFKGHETTATVALEGLLTSEARRRKQAIGSLVNLFVTSVDLERNDPSGQLHLECGLFAYRAELRAPQRELLGALKTLVYDEVIARPVVRQIESRGAHMIGQVWDVLLGMAEDLLPSQQRDTWREAKGNATAQRRVLCDYVSGMTDAYITQLYERLYQPHHGSPFDVQ